MKNVLVALILFQIQIVGAQNSIIDEKFGSNGYASTIRLLNRNFKKIFQSEDSGLLAVGEYQSSTQNILTVVKFKKNGQLDMAFGSAGVYNNAILPNSVITVNSACSTKDNSILICGTANQYTIYTKSIFILKLKEDGNLDSTFGNNGIKITLSGNIGFFSFIKEDNNQKIIVGLVRNVGGGDIDHYILKLKTNGEIDSSFQKHGELILNTTGTITIMNFEVSLDNHYLISYYTYGGRNPIFVNLDSNGNFNNKFGSYGKMYINVSPLNSSYSCGIVPTVNNGFYLYAHITIKSNLSSIIIVYKYSKNGLLDSSFGKNGITSKYISSQRNYGLDYFKIDNKSRIILGIRVLDSCPSIDPFGNDYYCDNTSTIFRFNSKGWPDSTFNNTGLFSTFKDCEFNDEVSDVLIQADNKIIVIGKILEKGTSMRSFMCRLNAFYPTANMMVDDQEQNKIKIFPMPFTDKINIDGLEGVSCVRIWSIQGQLIYQENISSPIIPNLGFLSVGHYILEVETKNKTTYRYKILKSE